MTITARFASQCPKCQTSIEIGEKVEWVKGSKATHKVCPMVRNQGDCQHPAFHKFDCKCGTPEARGENILAGRRNWNVEDDEYLSEQEMDRDDAAYMAWIQFQASQPTRVAVEDSGVYVMPDGSIVKVQANREKTRTYAKRWTVIPGIRLTEAGSKEHGEYVYEPSLVQEVARSGRKMSLEEAKAFILRYGQCARCSRELKDANSVERGIGPVCVKYFSLGTTAADLLVAA